MNNNNINSVKGGVEIEDILIVNPKGGTIAFENIGYNWKLLGMILTLLLVVMACANTTTRKKMGAVLRAMGVGVKRVPRVIKELKRKGFHFSGLCIPLIYLIGLNYTTVINHKFAYTLMGSISFAYFIWECLRLKVPAVRDLATKMYGGMMREHEKNSFNGVLFYLVGSTICIYYFSPIIAIASMLFLIIGDFCAALVGISFGRTKIFGKKSLEGTLAMFFVCLLISIPLFWKSNLCEQLSFWGSLAATLVELLNPSFIDDNITIPCISGLVIQLVSLRLNAQIPDYRVD